MESSSNTLEIKGLSKLTRSLKQYPKISEPIFQRAIDATGATFAKNTLKDDPVPWRDGILTQTFEFKPGRLKSVWRPRALYAPFVEFGTSKMAAQPYMGSIVDKSRDDINKLFAEALDLVTVAIARG